MDQNLIKKLANDEQGNTLVLALLVMVILSLLGVTAMTTSNTDMVISRSQNVYRINFALAEAAARLGSMAVRQAAYVPQQDQSQLGASEFVDAECPYWLHMELPDPDNIRDAQNWDVLTANTFNVGGEQVQYIVRYDGMSGILDASGNQTTYPFRYTIFGRSTQSGGEVIVQMGYMLILNRVVVDQSAG